MDDHATIFREEEQTIQHAQVVLHDEDYQQNPLMSEFSTLLRNYTRLYKQFRKLITLGDNQQLQLKQVHEQIEEQKRQLEQQNQELREAARLREDIERITRHDLKSPLNAIISLPSLILKNTSLTQDERQYLTTVMDAGLRMLHMINLSLDLFKMERGLYRFRPVAVNLLRIIIRIMDETKGLAYSKRLRSRMFVCGRPVTPEDFFIAAGEELLCYTLLSNLIKNALEASPEGECVTVNLDHEETMASIRIQNQGIVPEFIRERFFEKYVTAGKTGGTGLGTYSAKLIAEIQQGTIMMTSSEEEGTVVTIQLPRSAGSRANTNLKQQCSAPSGSQLTDFSGSLATLPADLAAQLQNAIEALDVPVIRNLIERIDPYDTAFAAWIEECVHEYRFDLLQALFEPDEMDSSQKWK